MSQDRPAFKPEVQKEIPVTPQVDPVKKYTGVNIPRPFRSQERDEERKYSGSGRNIEKFLPEGRTEIPLFAVDVKFGEKKEVLFVDTLAMQTKLGVTKRLSEQSMSMRDSEIVKTRNLSSTAFSQGGTIKVAGITPPSVLDLVGSTVLRESQVKMKQQAPRHLGAQPAQSSEMENVIFTPSGAIVMAPSKAVRERLQEIREKIERPQGVVVAATQHEIQDRQWGLREERQEKFEQRQQEFPTPQLPQVVLVETASGSAVAPVSGQKREDIVLEPVPVVDQSARVKELETENEVLVGIVARLSAENKILKAKK